MDPQALEQIERSREEATRTLPRFPAFTQVWLGEGWQKAVRVYSMLFILALALGLTVTPKSEPYVTEPAQRARGGDILRVGFGEPYVYFDHKRHQDEAKKDGSCGLCHHLHKAGDVGTPCSECHRSMYVATNTFDHNMHVAAVKGEPPCVKCHGEETPMALNVKKTCQDCHRDDMMATNPIVKKFDSQWAGSYKDAMHKMCIPCHAKMADPILKRPGLGRCGACHNEGTKSEQLYRATIQARKLGEGNL